MIETQVIDLHELSSVAAGPRYISDPANAYVHVSEAHTTHIWIDMCLYLKHIQRTYARTYAPDIRQSISHMHGLYWMHTKIYLHV